ncbi:MAG: MTH1187 family thiamine-binding protein [Hadesarchaea archaeon]|nr:MTH1187 family thiamine-binding protein [Hadesarchaea archaeon]
MIIAELTIVPLGTSDTALSTYVAEAVKEIDKSGLNYEVCPTGTVIEGSNLDEVMEVTKNAHKAVLNAGIGRVLTTLTIDERTNKEEKLDERVKKVLPK